MKLSQFATSRASAGPPAITAAQTKKASSSATMANDPHASAGPPAVVTDNTACAAAQ